MSHSRFHLNVACTRTIRGVDSSSFRKRHALATMTHRNKAPNWNTLFLNLSPHLHTRCKECVYICEGCRQIVTQVFTLHFGILLHCIDLTWGFCAVYGQRRSLFFIHIPLLGPIKEYKERIVDEVAQRRHKSSKVNFIIRIFTNSTFNIWMEPKSPNWTSVEHMEVFFCKVHCSRYELPWTIFQGLHLGSVSALENADTWLSSLLINFVWNHIREEPLQPHMKYEHNLSTSILCSSTSAYFRLLNPHHIYVYCAISYFFRLLPRLLFVRKRNCNLPHKC
jgi:hypothetical protein